MNFELLEEKKIKRLLDSSLVNRDYEFEIIFNKDKLTNGIDTNIFADTFKKLKSDKNFLFDETISLDIFLKDYNIRVSILGIDSINKYLKSEDINKISDDKIIYLKKTEVFDKKGLKLNHVLVSDYNLKIKVKKELKLSFNEDFIINIKSKWKTLLKTFRYKKRSSFIDLDKMFSIDLTLIKSDINSNINSNSNLPISPKYYKTLKESNILRNRELYELELEFVGNNNLNDDLFLKNKSKLDLKVVYEKMITYILYILSIIQKTKYILSNSKKIELLNNYYKLIKGDIDDYSQMKEKLKKGYCGIGPGFVSLSIDNLILNNIENKTCIREGYCVTDKVDGERHFLYIDSSGHGYLLNNALEFKDTILDFPNIRNCIYDGELVLHDKLKNRINHYLIFDCYFYNGEDVRHLPLKTSDSNDIKLDARLEKAKELSFQYKNIDNLLSLKETDLYLLEIKRKEFRESIYGNNEDIFKKSNSVWNNSNHKDYIYKIDGLIFTPVKSPVLDKYNSKDKFYSGKTWENVFKWKPPEHNTIDFLVKVQKEGSKDLIKYYKKEDKIIKYKTLLLFVGNYTTHKIINPYSLLFEKTDNENNNDKINDKLNDKINDKFNNKLNDKSNNKSNNKSNDKYSKNTGVYKEIEFIPSEPSNAYSYIANIPLVNKNGVDLMMPLHGKEPLKDGMIVEMYYDIKEDEEWRWKPRNIRFDKIKKREQGQQEFGNSYKTACNIWKSYFTPITEDMIFKGLNIPDSSLDLKTRYYHSEVDRKSSNLIALRDFHNLFIKDILYKSAGKFFEKIYLLELGCGKGGDLNRWIKYNYNLVVGIDLYLDNIENKNNGCIERYLNDRNQNKDNLMVFMQGDCRKNIKEGNFTFNLNYKNIFDILWNGKNNISNLGKIDKRLLGICGDGFNIISCQFALHYFFENEITFTNFLNNLEENIKDDGLFIGTCFDGRTIFNKFKDLEKNDEIKYELDDKLIWSIKKNYSEKEFKNDESSLGKKIDVYVSSIGGTQPEYLVNFDYFINKMSERGFKLLDSDECNKYSLKYGDNTHSTGLFKDLYSNLLNDIDNKYKYGKAYTLDSDKKIMEYSFFNRWFIFKKYKLITIKPKKNKINIIKNE